MMTKRMVLLLLLLLLLLCCAMFFSLITTTCRICDALFHFTFWGCHTSACMTLFERSHITFLISTSDTSSSHLQPRAMMLECARHR